MDSGNNRSEIMARQASIDLTLPSKGVIVVGCGGVGSWTAYYLGLAGVSKLWLFDPDTLEIHNLNRIPLPAGAVGQRKSAAVADLIRGLRPDCTILPLMSFTPASATKLGCADADWLVCTTDTLASRYLAYGWAMQNGVKYIEAAAEGDQGSVAGSPAEWATEAETQPGYASVPVWIGPSVAAAYLAVAHILHDTELGDRCIRMGFDSGPSGPDGGSSGNGGKKEFVILDSTAEEDPSAEEVEVVLE